MQTDRDALTVRRRVEAALSQEIDPCLDRDLVTARAIQGIVADERGIRVAVGLGFPAELYKARLAPRITGRLAALREDDKIQVDVSWRIGAYTTQSGTPALSGVKNVVAVASPQGGVGKSTVAAHLALGLAREGAAVGLLDADLYSPTQPYLLGLEEVRQHRQGDCPVPLASRGVRCMSAGFIGSADSPRLWRGPLAAQTLAYLARHTAWGELDYLIVDLPPGAGEVHQALVEHVAVAGAVLVTAGDDRSAREAVRGVRMFDKLGIPVLGAVENFSAGTHAPRAGLETELLATLPRDERIAAGLDIAPESLGGWLALRIAARLSLQRRDFNRGLPQISVRKEEPAPGA